MRDSLADHIADALLDAYAASTLAEPDLAYVEEHLLVCAFVTPAEFSITDVICRRYGFLRFSSEAMMKLAHAA
jgi:hypothetical protein